MKQHTLLRPNGFIIASGPNGTFEADTQQCVHCGGHWQVSPGSGKRRGYCGRCKGHFCSPKCSKCVPMEQMLENMEAGRPDDFVPTKASVLWTP